MTDRQTEARTDPHARLRIFISSTHNDLAEHRQRVADIVERLGHDRSRMETFGARPRDALVESLDEIATADAFVGIYAHRYGHVPVGLETSITEAEFSQAAQHDVPTFCFVVDDDYPWPPKQVEDEPGRTKLRAFKERIATSVVLDRFTTPDDLAIKVGTALSRFLVQRTVRSALDASAVSHPAGSSRSRSQVARRAERLTPIIDGAIVLLVNDAPDEMQHVVGTLRSLHVEVHIATTTEMALAMSEATEYDAVISDMRRGDDQEAGIELIAAMRKQGLHQPTILTPGRYQPELGTPAFAFGITNRTDELLNLLFDTLERTRG